MNLKRLIATTLSSVMIAMTLLITVAVAPVAASTQGSCSSFDMTKVWIYENKIGVITDGNDTLWSCGNATVLPTKTTPTYCAGTMMSWDNCASSYIVSVTAQTRFCAYTGTNYTNGLVIVNIANSTASDITYSRANVSSDNSWSSHRWVGVTYPC